LVRGNDLLADDNVPVPQ